MGLINAKLGEKLAKTFLDAQHRFCSHILPLGTKTVVHSGTSDRYRLVFGHLWQRDSPVAGAAAPESDRWPASRRWENRLRPCLACVAQLIPVDLSGSSLRGRIPLW